MHHLHRSKSIYLTILALIGLNIVALAQKNNQTYDYRPLHFGFNVGLHNARFKLTESLNLRTADTLLSLTADNTPGFQVGFVADMRLHENLSLRFVPQFLIGQRNLQYNFDNARYNRLQKIRYTGFDFPLLLKLRSDRIDNYRIYVVGGGKFGLDFASQQDVVEEVIRVKTKRFDYGYEVGVGADIYFPYFKLSPELKVSNGVRNTRVAEPHIYSSAIDKLFAQTIQFSLYFE
jgi:hypothetical protein